MATLSWNIVKLSLEFLWTKHKETPSPGGIESYGRPELYLGLGLAGWVE